MYLNVVGWLVRQQNAKHMYLYMAWTYASSRRWPGLLKSMAGLQEVERQQYSAVALHRVFDRNTAL